MTITAIHQMYLSRLKPLNISTIEKTLYKTKFENEPMQARLSRIESSVFGTVFANDSESERISRISSAINAQKSANDMTATSSVKTWQRHFR